MPAFKSTTMRVLAGLVPPTAGRVLVAGLDVQRQTMEVKRRTGYCPDVGGLVPRATPWEHLQLAGRLRRLEPGWETRARDLLERFELGDVTHRVTAGFSHGMGRRLSVLLPVVDVGHLVRFRVTTSRGRRTRWVVAALFLLTLAAAGAPAFLPGADATVEGREQAFWVLLLLPSAYAAFLALAVVSAVASGGGRELLPRDQAAPFPVSPATDHLGALLMAPLNIAWLLQAWLLLWAWSVRGT